jgi:choline dehydrogenase
MLGGSSSMNAMIYIRGNRHDYDTWRDEYGCSGWGYSDLMPYFRRAESNSRGADAYHGGTGPLSVSDLAFQSALTKTWVAAARECGLPANDDFNGAQQDGSGFYQVTQKDGRRCSAADAYLRPAMARPNLEVKTDARVTKVVVEGGRAAGVRYLQRGVEETAYVQGEVILSAGTIGSPQLLMLSGIGPADHLRDVGASVVVDSPGVGANLSDHPVVPAIWRTPKVPALWEKAGPKNLFRWQLRHSGPFTSNVAESGGFSRTRPSLSAPDLQWHALPTPFLNQGLADPQTRAFTLLITLVDVGSRGRIWLRSTDPRHKPAIDPAYLSDSTDIAPLVEGVRMAREFAVASPLAKVCTEELAPGPGVHTDAEVREWIRRDLGTLYHPVGTCAMGGDSRLAAAKITSVVDPELRVRGVEGLRVVDASVMPAVPRGNTNAPTVAIAERAADLILGRAPLEPVDPALEPEPLPAELA